MNLLIDYSILIYFCTSHATHLLFVTLIQNVIINYFGVSRTICVSKKNAAFSYN